VPEVVIIAGPNGAGKTTFADEYLAARLTHFEFVNADEIAREVALQGLPQPHADKRCQDHARPDQPPRRNRRRLCV
jgi:predicted ABC-type ATPase